MKPVMQAIQRHPELEMTVVCGGTMVLERFGYTVDVVRRDGFTVDEEVYMELEGNTPLTMAKSLGYAVVEFSNVLKRVNPELVLMIGDRYEAMGACLAAAYMNLTIVYV
jgi:UDP-N-acetylglucosamine 2-epimerase